MRLKIALVLASFILTIAAFAQLGGKSPSVIVAPIAPVTVSRGSSAPVEMDFRVGSGFHINSNQPRGEFLLPTSLKLDPPSDIVVSRVSFPAGEDRSFPFAPDEKLNVYSGDFAVNAVVNTTGSISPGTYRVRGTLTYQACDNAACFPPKKLPVEFDVKVTSGPARSGRRNPGQSPHVH